MVSEEPEEPEPVKEEPPIVAPSTPEPTKNEHQVEVVIEKTPEPQPEPEPVKEPEPEPEPKEEPKKEEPKPEPKVEPKVEEEAKKEPSSPTYPGVRLRKTGKLTQIAEAGTLRKPSSSTKDPSKRMTIAGESGLFSNVKSSELNESKTKDDMDTPSETQEKGETNEFSKMFIKLKKKSSVKRLLLEKEDERPHRPNTPVDRPASVESIGETKPAESKPKLPESKPKLPESKPKVAESKPKPAESKPAIPAVKPVLPTKPKDLTAKPAEKQADKIPDEEKPKEEPKPKSEPKTLVIVKEEKPESKPVQRAQSVKTVPVAKENKKPDEPTVEMKPSPKVKRANTVPSSKVKTESPSTSNAEAKTSEPQKRGSGHSCGSGGDEPAWFAMARRKTKDWNDKEKDLESKEKKDNSNMAVKKDMEDMDKKDSLIIEDKKEVRFSNRLTTFIVCIRNFLF